MFIFSRARFLFLATLFIFVFGCSSSSHVIVGTTRPPISISQVKLYLDPPSKYEKIALVEASSKNSLATGDQSKMNTAIERLKEEAANLGANGLILQVGSNELGATVNTLNLSGNTGTGVGVPVMHKHASGLAIYVPEE